jgi:hypothetical protein
MHDKGIITQHALPTSSSLGNLDLPSTLHNYPLVSAFNSSQPARDGVQMANAIMQAPNMCV